MIKYLFAIGIMLSSAQLAYSNDRMESSVTEEIGFELLHFDEYEIAKPFFKDFKINIPLLFSVLENRCAGKVFTDHKSNPSFILVHNPVSYTFLGGEPDEIALRKIAAFLKTLPRVSLVSPIDWKFRAFFEEEGFIPIARQQLKSPLDSYHFKSWIKRIPDRYSIVKINKDNLAQCNWNSFISKFYGDDNRFLTNGMGFALAENGKIVSESYALIANGKAEIGVITDEKYRGQNLGTTISAVMLDYCHQNNLEPFWSCDVSNPASSAIAKKLGFEEDCGYIFLRWIAP